MTRPILPGLAALATIAAAPALAEIAGGDLTLSYSQFLGDLETSDGDGTTSSLGLGGSAEFALERPFALQVDLNQSQVALIDDTATMLGVHGIYRFGEVTSLGAFVAHDTVPDSDYTYAGVEAKRIFADFDGEGYLAWAGGEGSDATLWGVSAAFRRGPNFDLGVAFDRLDGDDDTSLTRLSGRAGYDLTARAQVAAEFGVADVDVADISDTAAFAGVSLRYSFGAFRGATFDRRGLLQLLPGL